MNQKYRFAKTKDKFTKYIKVIDYVGYKFHSPKKFYKLKTFSSITVIQLGHLGDFLLTLPFLAEFKDIFPDKKLSLAVLPENYKLAKKFDFIDEVKQIRQSNLSRSYKEGYIATIADYKSIKSDVIFELRGDIRILMFLKLFSEYKSLVGYREGGFGFLLDYYLEYPFLKHISQTYFNFLDILIGNKSKIKKIDLPYKVIQDIPNNYIMININSGAQSKNWNLHNFIMLAEMIIKKYSFNITFSGVLDENNYHKFNISIKENRYKSFIYNYVNKTSIEEVFYLIKKSVYFIGLDSGLTHAATFFQKDILALYSDMTHVEVWRPYQFHNSVNIIKKSVECGYCGSLNCVDNKCMKLITVDEVFEKFEKMYMEMK